MNINVPKVLTYAAVVPLYTLSAAGWVVIVGAAVVSNLVARPAVEVPRVVVPKDEERIVA
jgi:hypothetical protein